MEREKRSSLTLRLPPELKGWVEACARENVRTANAEIVFLLEQVRKAKIGAALESVASASGEELVGA